MSQAKFKVGDKVKVTADLSQLMSIGIVYKPMLILNSETEITQVLTEKEYGKLYLNENNYRIATNKVGYIIPESYLEKI